MKLITSFLILIGFLLIPCFAQTIEPQPSDADRFVEQFSRRMEIIKMPLSDEQKEALRTVHPLLVFVADHEYIRMSFWEMVRQNPTTKIEWAEAKKLVQQGLVSLASQAHSRQVSLMTRDGHTFTTMEPQMDDILRLVQEVDPKMLFIGYETE